mmetsp:Transcript_146722/g.256240  ORF Transcript_146722/g.256240 Transcript_146722/m.256240 type:complete len:208 (-) Transcript_146722:115-738(-)
MNEHSLPKIKHIRFSYFPACKLCKAPTSIESAYANEFKSNFCGGNGKCTLTTSKNLITLHFTFDDPATKQHGKQDHLLVAMYAWDKIAYPGTGTFRVMVPAIRLLRALVPSVNCQTLALARPFGTTTQYMRHFTRGRCCAVLERREVYTDQAPCGERQTHKRGGIAPFPNHPTDATTSKLGLVQAPGEPNQARNSVEVPVFCPWRFH